MATSEAEAPQPVEMNALSSPAAPGQTASLPSENAIGAVGDSPVEVQEAPDQKVVSIVLLIPATGRRHTYTIGMKYLAKRNVTNVENNDPFNLTVSTMKDLILRDWKAEWEPRPADASFIRLILMGRELEDSKTLRGMSLCISFCHAEETRRLTYPHRMPTRRDCAKCCSYDGPTTGPSG
jgi:hypothetical protein